MRWGEGVWGEDARVKVGGLGWIRWRGRGTMGRWLAWGVGMQCGGYRLQHG